MSGNFEFSKENRDGVTVVTLAGLIDEDAMLEEVFKDVLDEVLIDTAAIARINSCGIRTWVNVMTALSAGKRVVFIECSPAMVRQFNMISNFGGRGTVRSFRLPYYCDKCDAEHEFTVQVEGYQQEHPDGRAPAYRCPTCRGPLEFDDLEDRYFGFMEAKGPESGV